MQLFNFSLALSFTANADLQTNILGFQYVCLKISISCESANETTTFTPLIFIISNLLFDYIVRHTKSFNDLFLYIYIYIYIYIYARAQTYTYTYTYTGTIHTYTTKIFTKYEDVTCSQNM